MGWINMLVKGRKVAGKVIKRTKEDAPFAVAVAGVEVGRHIVNKLVGAKDIHEGTITGTVKHIKNRKKDKKDKE